MTTCSGGWALLVALPPVAGVARAAHDAPLFAIPVGQTSVVLRSQVSEREVAQGRDDSLRQVAWQIGALL